MAFINRNPSAKSLRGTHASYNATCSAGMKFDAPAIQLFAPHRKESTAWSSAPQIRCNPEKLTTCSSIRANDPLDSLIAQIDFTSATLSRNEGDMSTPVRAGKLYKMIGRGTVAAIRRKCATSSSVFGSE